MAKNPGCVFMDDCVIVALSRLTSKQDGDFPESLATPLTDRSLLRRIY